MDYLSIKAVHPVHFSFSFSSESHLQTAQELRNIVEGWSHFCRSSRSEIQPWYQVRWQGGKEGVMDDSRAVKKKRKVILGNEKREKIKDWLSVNEASEWKRAQEHGGEEKRGSSCSLLFSFKQTSGMWPSFPSLLQNSHEHNSQHRTERERWKKNSQVQIMN